MSRTTSSVNIPTVIERGAGGECSYDIYSRLLKDRIIFLNGEIDDDTATIIVAQLLFLNKEDPNEEIKFYIMSNGGSVFSALAIYDTMKHVTCPIATYCIGYAFSAGAFLLSSGTKGRRFSLPSSRIMIHQPWCHVLGGEAEDLQIEAEQAKITKQMLLNYLSENTSKSTAELERVCQRDTYFLASQAKDFGLIDKIVQRKKTKSGSRTF